MTGKRLKQLGLPYKTLINSNMTRAQETAEIVFEELDKKLPREENFILREGAPYQPEPAIDYWKQPRLVSLQ